jgi:Ca2+-binding EF-hand superfamily protein
MSSIISSISSHLASNIFSKLDTSNTGSISEADFTSAMTELAGDDTDVSSLVSSVDSDSDGQITESELTTGIENLLSQLNSSSSNGRGMPPPPPGGMNGMQGMGGMGGGMQGMGGMPPPPPPSGEDEGVTADQASEIAASTDDENFASLMTDISENFDEIDTDSDGKVTRDEAMAYKDSQTSSSSTTSETSATTSNNSSATDALIKELMAKLVETYGLSASSSESTSVTETA